MPSNLYSQEMDVSGYARKPDGGTVFKRRSHLCFEVMMFLKHSFLALFEVLFLFRCSTHAL